MGLFQSDNPKEKDHKGILGAFSVDVIKWEPENSVRIYAKTLQIY